MKTLVSLQCAPINAFVALGAFLIPISLSASTKTGYETNKFDLKAKVEDGGWTVAWADDISETDVAEGLVSGGVSIGTANPAPFVAWCQNLVNRTIDSLMENAEHSFPNEVRDNAQHLVEEVIRDAINGHSTRETLKRYDTVDFKGGAIRYSGKNLFLGHTVSRTWGIKPYVAFRWRSSGPLVGTDAANASTEVAPMLWVVKDGSLGWLDLERNQFHRHMDVSHVSGMTTFDDGAGPKIWLIMDGKLGWVDLAHRQFHGHMPINDAHGMCVYDEGGGPHIFVVHDGGQLSWIRLEGSEYHGHTQVGNIIGMTTFDDGAGSKIFLIRSDGHLGWMMYPNWTFHDYNWNIHGAKAITTFDNGGGPRISVIRNSDASWLDLDRKQFHDHHGMDFSDVEYMTPFANE